MNGVEARKFPRAFFKAERVFRLAAVALTFGCDGQESRIRPLWVNTSLPAESFVAAVLPGTRAECVRFVDIVQRAWFEGCANSITAVPQLIPFPISPVTATSVVWSDPSDLSTHPSVPVRYGPEWTSLVQMPDADEPASWWWCRMSRGAPFNCRQVEVPDALTVPFAAALRPVAITRDGFVVSPGLMPRTPAVLFRTESQPTATQFYRCSQAPACIWRPVSVAVVGTSGAKGPLDDAARVAGNGVVQGDTLLWLHAFGDTISRHAISVSPAERATVEWSRATEAEIRKWNPAFLESVASGSMLADLHIAKMGPGQFGQGLRSLFRRLFATPDDVANRNAPVLHCRTFDSAGGAKENHRAILLPTGFSPHRVFGVGRYGIVITAIDVRESPPGKVRNSMIGLWSWNAVCGTKN